MFWKRNLGETNYFRHEKPPRDGEFLASRRMIISPGSPAGNDTEHVPRKLLDFFDQDMLQLFDIELRPYRSNLSI
jgi:hypothetical protein